MQWCIHHGFLWLAINLYFNNPPLGECSLGLGFFLEFELVGSFSCFLFFKKFRQYRKRLVCNSVHVHKNRPYFATVVEFSPPKQESHSYVLVQFRRKRTELAKFEKESGDVRRRSRFDFLLLFPCNLWLCWFLYQGLNGLKIFHCNSSTLYVW